MSYDGDNNSTNIGGFTGDSLPSVVSIVPPTTLLPQPPRQAIDLNINISIGTDNSRESDLAVREEHEAFVLAMSKEIRSNHFSEGWDDVPLEELTRRAEERLSELKAAIELRMSRGTILTEAADCANFLMMIADNYAKGYED